MRIITATNTDLLGLVESRQFRQDLHYRLQILCLPLPPLGERGGDPELLAAHFVRVGRARFRCSEKSLDPASVPLLNAYSSPGNVRELENLIQRGCCSATGRW